MYYQNDREKLISLVDLGFILIFIPIYAFISVFYTFLDLHASSHFLSLYWGDDVYQDRANTIFIINLAYCLFLFITTHLCFSLIFPQNSRSTKRVLTLLVTSGVFYFQYLSYELRSQSQELFSYLIDATLVMGFLCLLLYSLYQRKIITPQRATLKPILFLFCFIPVSISLYFDFINSRGKAVQSESQRPFLYTILLNLPDATETDVIPLQHSAHFIEDELWVGYAQKNSDNNQLFYRQIFKNTPLHKLHMRQSHVGSQFISPYNKEEQISSRFKNIKFYNFSESEPKGLSILTPYSPQYCGTTRAPVPKVPPQFLWSGFYDIGCIPKSDSVEEQMSAILSHEAPTIMSQESNYSVWHIPQSHYVDNSLEKSILYLKEQLASFGILSETRIIFLGDTLQEKPMRLFGFLKFSSNKQLKSLLPPFAEESPVALSHKQMMQVLFSDKISLNNQLLYWEEPIQGVSAELWGRVFYCQSKEAGNVYKAVYSPLTHGNQAFITQESLDYGFHTSAVPDCTSFLKAQLGKVLQEDPLITFKADLLKNLTVLNPALVEAGNKEPQ